VWLLRPRKPGLTPSRQLFQERPSRRTDPGDRLIHHRQGDRVAAQRSPVLRRNLRSLPAVAAEYPSYDEAGVATGNPHGPAPRLTVHAAHRRRIGPIVARGLTEGPKAASTKAVMTASRTRLRRGGAALGPARDGRCRPAFVVHGDLVGDSTGLLGAGRRSSRCVGVYVPTSAETPIARCSVAGVTGYASSAGTDRVVERRRAVALARHFRELEGLSIVQIADRLGRSPATVKAYFYDPS
jgi:hypothetical protein